MDTWIAVAVALGMVLVGFIVGRALEQGRQNRLKQGAREEASRVAAGGRTRDRRAAQRGRAGDKEQDPPGPNGIRARMSRAA